MAIKSTPTLFINLIVLIIGLQSCQSIKEPEFRRISNFEIVKPGIQESDILIDLEFENLNSYKVNLKNVQCSLFVEENYLGTFMMDSLISIRANEIFILPLKGKINMRTLLQNSWNIAFKEEVNIKAEGKGKLGRAGIYVNYPFVYEGKHSLKALLK